MRVIERLKQDIWVSNAGNNGRGQYQPAFKIRATVSPRDSAAAQQMFGVEMDYDVVINNTAKTFQGKGIKQNSQFWLGRASAPDVKNDGCTHKPAAGNPVILTTDGQNIFIALRQQEVYNVLD